MRLDSSGNLGLGVTPSAWSGSVASQVGDGAALSSRAAGNTASDMTHGAYWNGTNWLYQDSSVGAARYQMTGANAGSTHAWFVSAGGTAGNAISFSQVMTVSSDGTFRVKGAGTAGSTDAFQVSGSAPADAARITSGGDLLVGTTDAGATTGGGVKALYSATIPAMFTVFNTAGGGNAYNLYNTNATNNGYRFYVKVDGGIANYQANDLNLSDQRLKKDVSSAGGYLDKICAIPVRTFRYKDQSDDALNLGVIAQEVETIAPELVNNDGFGEIPDDGVPLKTIYQTDLQYALMKCVQELKAELDSVKAELATLKGQP
jgi:hypothetical protein